MKPGFNWQTVLAALFALGLGLGRTAAVDVQTKNDLKQIALYYQAFNADHGRYPKALKEFQDYIKRDAPALHKALADGRFVLVPTRNPGSATVLAYEKKPNKWQHTVVMGDGAATSMGTAKLKQALQNAK
jgi:hypothetical protein